MRKLTLLVVAALFVSGCGDNDAANTTAGTTATTEVATTTNPPSTTEAIPETPILEIIGPAGTVSLTLADLQAMPSVEGWAGGLSSTGSISVPEMHRGVPLTDLADLVGGVGEGFAVEITAKDGYSITFSFDQAANGAFVAYDPGSGQETTPSGNLTAMIAYERAGAPIPADEDGPLRMAVVSRERDQIVDGHWNVKWVTTLTVREAVADWVLALSGDGTENLDRATFDSCLSCHGVESTDAEGGVWTGVPLYLIAGRIDGGEAHGDGAYDRALAEAGYVLRATAVDGFEGEIPIEAFHLVDDVLLASLLDGEPLGDDGPVRIVGPGLTGKQRVAQVVTISLDIAAGEAAGSGDGTPVDALPPAGTGLSVGGAVAEELDLDTDGLAAFGAVEAQIEHPRDGEQTHVGIPIAALLDEAGPEGSATTLTVVASDGYRADIDLAELSACGSCLLAFDGDVLSMALPGFSMSAWVKDVVAFELS